MEFVLTRLSLSDLLPTQDTQVPSQMKSKVTSDGLEMEQTQPSHAQEHQSASHSGNCSIKSNKCSSPPCERPFLCPVDGCNGRFHRNFTLREHLKTHTGEKPFQCQVKWCGKRFKTSGNMSRHRRLHLQKQFQCPAEGCLRIFTKQEKLALHYRIHMGSDAFPCTVPGCPKTFSTSGNLTRHMRRHHPGIGCTESLCAADMSSSSEHRTVSPSVICARPAREQHDTVTVDQRGSTHEPNPVSDQELLELLQCLFWDELPPTATPSYATTVAPPHFYSLSYPQFGRRYL